ncbi:MAG: phage portal protein [Clostridiaceae bacterium]
MNIIDRAIAFVNPQKALNRQFARYKLDILNSGYSEGGASHHKKSMKGYKAFSASPREDIDLNLQTLRHRSRDMFMNAPLATSALKTTRTNVVGSGLKLKSRIDAEFLGITEEYADEWEKNTEREFALWAESKFCDSLRINDFYDLQQLALLGWLMNGESIALIRYDKSTPYMPYGLRLHLIESDRLSTPKSNIIIEGIETINPDNKNKIISGVEIDNNGAIVAYHISNDYPQSFLKPGLLDWQRIEAYGKDTGEPNVLHIFEAERAEQRRGVPLLAPVIESLKQITRYTEAELMAAVISGMFTVFVKSEGPSNENPLGSMIPAEEQIEDDNSEYNYEMGNGAINILGPGESIEIANPSRPSANFDGFVSALARYIGAALEIPQELLQKSFNSSYSASRAALLEAWKMFKMKRIWIAKEFCQPVYEQWLIEAVASGRIKAPGFFNDPIIKKAWSKAEWNGPSPGQVDPVKEVNAAILRVNNGFSTRERETTELTGGDFDSNVKQLQREAQLMNEINPQNASVSTKGGE